MSSKKQNLGTKAVGKGKEKLREEVACSSRGLVMSFLAGAVQAAPTVQDIEFSSRPGSKFEVRMDFNEPPPEIKAYTIEKPARIAIDFPIRQVPGAEALFTALRQCHRRVVLESGDRTRLVVNLVKLVPYETRVEGNSLYLVVGQEGGDYVKQATDPHRWIQSCGAGDRCRSRSLTCSSSAPATVKGG